MSESSRMNVVLIGVDHYSSERVPDTWGARADLCHLWRVCVDQLQVPAERILLVTPGALRPEELVAGISRDREVWLRHAERSPRHEGARLADLTAILTELANRTEEGDAAWIHFSGHGATTGHTDTLADLVLCAQDFEDPSRPEGALTFDALARLFRRPSIGEQVTLSLDCCWTGDDQGPETHPALLPVPFRVLVGASPDRAARVVRLAGVEQGAFSWALGVALSRWTRGQTDGTAGLRVTHADLMAWVRQLLLVGLGIDQHPMIAGPRGVDARPVFGPPALSRTDAGPADGTVPLPDRYCPRRQLWAGTTDIAIYALGWTATGQPTTALGFITVDATSLPGVEVWQMKADRLWLLLYGAAHGVPGTLGITRVTQAPPSNPDDVTWQLAQDEIPTHPSGGQEASASVIFRTESGSFMAMLGFDFVAKEGGAYLLQAVRWWASERAGLVTLNPVQGGDPAIYVGTTTSQTLSAGDWIWPPQSVNQLLDPVGD